MTMTSTRPAFRDFLAEADNHLFAYGHDMTWASEGRGYAGTCERCTGRAFVRPDGRGVLRVTGDSRLVPRHGDFAECAALTGGPGRPRSTP